MTVRRKSDGVIHEGICFRSSGDCEGLENDCIKSLLILNKNDGSAKFIGYPSSPKDWYALKTNLELVDSTIGYLPRGVYSKEALNKLCEMQEEYFKLNGRFNFISNCMQGQSLCSLPDFFSDRFINDGEARPLPRLLSTLMANDLESNAAFYVGLPDLLTVDQLRYRLIESRETNIYVYMSGDQIIRCENDELLMTIIYGKWIDGQFHRAQDQYARLPTITQIKNKTNNCSIRIPKAFKLYSIEEVIKFLGKKAEFFAIIDRENKYFKADEVREHLIQCLTKEKLENNMYYLDKLGFSPARPGGPLNALEDSYGNLHVIHKFTFCRGQWGEDGNFYEWDND